MITVEQYVDIERPLPEVFAFFQDFSNHQRFSGAFTETRQLSEGPVGIGTRVRKVAGFLGNEIAAEQEVTAFEPNRLIRLRTVSGPVVGNEQYLFEEENGRTRLTVTLTSKPTGLFSLALPFLKKKVQNQMAQDFLSLKKMLEAGS